MAKQYVFNFKTMQFELVECDELLTLIDTLNEDCSAQQGLTKTPKLEITTNQSTLEG
jgi:hypothetical protein